MFTTRKKNLTMTRGDTMAFGLHIKGLGHPADSVRFSCSKSNGGNIVFSKDLTDSLVETEDTDPIYRIRIAPEDTNSIDPGDYLYDFEVRMNNDVFTVMKGTLTIEPDITR